MEKLEHVWKYEVEGVNVVVMDAVRLGMKSEARGVLEKLAVELEDLVAVELRVSDELAVEDLVEVELRVSDVLAVAVLVTDGLNVADELAVMVLVAEVLEVKLEGWA